MLGHLSDDLAGKVAIESSDQGGGDDRAGLDLVSGERLLQSALKIGAIVQPTL